MVISISGTGRKYRVKPVVPYMNVTKTQSFDHPVVLRISLAIFIGSKSMCNTLDRVYNRASKIIRRVYFPLVPVAIILL